MSRGGKNPEPIFDKGQGKFKQNDVVAVTRLEYEGDTQSCPVDPDASKLDCVVSGVGPAYVDIVVDAGKFEEVRQAAKGRELTHNAQQHNKHTT